MKALQTSSLDSAMSTGIVWVSALVRLFVSTDVATYCPCPQRGACKSMFGASAHSLRRTGNRPRCIPRAKQATTVSVAIAEANSPINSSEHKTDRTNLAIKSSIAAPRTTHRARLLIERKSFHANRSRNLQLSKSHNPKMVRR